MYNTSMKLSELLIELHIHYLSPIRQVGTLNNITTSQLLCIISIPYNGISQSDLARKLSLDISTLSRNLEKLVNKNIIIKQASTNDRRSSIIILTNEGKAIYEKLTLELEQNFNDIYNNLEFKDVEALTDAIQKINWELMKRAF